MPKRVKMLTSKWHRKQEHIIHTFRLFQCIRFVKKQFFSVANNREGGGDIRLYPLLGPEGNLTGQNWHIAHLQNKTTIRPLRHILRQFFLLTKSPCWVPGGLDWTKIAHAQLDHAANKM